MSYLVVQVSSPECPIIVGQRLTAPEHDALKDHFGDDFSAIGDEDLDYITDVNGKQMLINRTHTCILLNGQPLIHILCLGFDGTPSELLRKHGLIYYSNGINMLEIERNWDVDQVMDYLEMNDSKDDFDYEDVESYLDDPISFLETSVRCSNELAGLGIETINDLVMKTESELREHRRFSLTSLNEVKESLCSLGLHLGMDTI